MTCFVSLEDATITFLPQHSQSPILFQACQHYSMQMTLSDLEIRPVYYIECRGQCMKCTILAFIIFSFFLSLDTLLSNAEKCNSATSGGSQVACSCPNPCQIQISSAGSKHVFPVSHSWRVLSHFLHTSRDQEK